MFYNLVGLDAYAVNHGIFFSDRVRHSLRLCRAEPQEINKKFDFITLQFLVYTNYILPLKEVFLNFFKVVGLIK